MACLVRKMEKRDLAQVSAIDREAFPTMWPPVNFHHEMTNRLAHYVVACDPARTPPGETGNTLQLVPVRSFWGIRWPFSGRSANTPALERVEFINGFVGMWLMVDEAHVINIAVRAECRGKGIGELLLIASMDMAYGLKATCVTLEVRASNSVAQNLYTKYGFVKVGVRKGYYTDNKEDAHIMTTDILTMSAFKTRYQKLRAGHFQKLGPCEYRIDGQNPS